MIRLGVKLNSKILWTLTKKKKNDFINKIKNSSAKKNALITAKKIVQKYKLMKKPKKKTYLVSDIESHIESDDDPQISIVEAANKVLDFNALKKDQEKQRPQRSFKNTKT